MLGTALRVAVMLAILGVVAYVAAVKGRVAGLATLLALAGAPFTLWVLLPRAAHRAFRRGNYKRAKFLYKILSVAVLRRRAQAAVEVSLAACALAVEDFKGALSQLERIHADALEDAARAVWLNNRGYALARDGQDPHAALACCDQAISLRPDVAGFRHTRGVALLALGRVDEAIAELERLWDDLAGDIGDDLLLLEAERCYDLGVAWRDKGEGDYAADYLQRAHRASPGSRWAERAKALLASLPGAGTQSALAELLDG